MTEQKQNKIFNLKVFFIISLLLGNDFRSRVNKNTYTLLSNY